MAGQQQVAPTADVATTAPEKARVYLSALVPVFNEVATLEEIVGRLEQIDIVRQIVVVDDCSTDGTRAIIERLQREGRVTAGYHAQNAGKGAALRSAVALVNQDYAVIQDADLEYDPNDLYRLAAEVERSGAQVIYGSRFMGSRRTGMLLSHYLGNRMLTLAFNLLLRQRITDLETCYKLFRTSLLRQIGIDSNRFSVDPELSAKVVRAGHPIREVPVSYVGRPYVSGKKIKPIDAWHALTALWRYRRWTAPGRADGMAAPVAEVAAVAEEAALPTIG